MLEYCILGGQSKRGMLIFRQSSLELEFQPHPLGSKLHTLVTFKDTCCWLTQNIDALYAKEWDDFDAKLHF